MKATNSDAADFFGGSLALSTDGNTLAIAAAGEDSAATLVNGNQADDSALESGAAYVFTAELRTARWTAGFHAEPRHASA